MTTLDVHDDLATRPVDWDLVVRGALLGIVGTVFAVAFKTRCGLAPGTEAAFLQACYSDVPVLWTGERLNEGAVPYLDHPVEYPPLTGLWMWLAALGARDGFDFVLRTYGFLVLCGGAIGGMLAQMVGLRRALVLTAAPTLVVSGAVNWDLPSMVLAVAGLLAHRRGRDGWAGLWLGLGTAAKLWPVLLVGPVVVAAWRLRGRRAGLAAAGAAAGAWLLTNAPVYVAAPDGWLRFLELSRERGPTNASLWRLVPDLLDVEPSVLTMNTVSGVVTVVGAAVLLGIALRRDPPAQWHLVGLPVVALFILAGKVYSPQFSLWLLPLLALALPRLGPLVAFFVADVAVHMLEFPYIGGELGLEGAGNQAALDLAVAVRAGLVVWIAIEGWRREVARTSDPAPAVVA